MNALIIYLTRFADTDLARSALPDAPVRPDRPKRRKHRWLRAG
jgi:hypothetical protein